MAVDDETGQQELDESGAGLLDESILVTIAGVAATITCAAMPGRLYILTKPRLLKLHSRMGQSKFGTQLTGWTFPS